MSAEPIASLYMVNLDCADPRTMARFYAALLGWEMPHCEDDYSMVSNGSTSIGFGKIDGYRAPQWPDSGSTKRYHLDLGVGDLEEAEAEAAKLGATVPAFQPGADRWRVMLDPAGHPFCLVPQSPAS
ncbi:MAG: VOC family protein [Actinomycetota bacterium]|nr:VOC family protein [Actinomycetota bacterium]MDA8359183.1 VOC family protein [Actinomycetota bacterium]